jgi:uracil-DNA glycosylase
MQALVAFTERLRRVAPADVPDFDPFDGGVDAECLFLLEAPGAKAVGSGFISRNNPDETASNFFAVNAEVGLSRSRTLTWNAVPWYIGSGTRIRAATSRDLEDAEQHLEELFGLLPRLRVVVLVGRKAQRLGSVVSRLAPSMRVLSCSHPSPLSLNGRPERRAEMLACLQQGRSMSCSVQRWNVSSNLSIEATSQRPLCGLRAAPQLSLTQARSSYLQFGASRAQDLPQVRAPRPEEMWGGA